MVPWGPATAQGIRAAYQGTLPLGFVRDGLMFVHKQLMYAPGPTPLALLWKDATCSRYLVDTDKSGAPLEEQQVTLRLRVDGTVVTEDSPPIVLAQMPDAFVVTCLLRGEEGGPRHGDSKLLRFALGEHGVQLDPVDGSPQGAQLRYLGVAGQQRGGRGDILSKILFQQMVRKNKPLGLEQILEVADPHRDGGGMDIVL